MTFLYTHQLFVLAAKMAGVGGEGMTLEPERTKEVLREAGAETFVELDPFEEGLAG